MHAQYRTALYTVLALSVLANHVAHAKKRHPAEPPAPSPSSGDGDIDIWELRTFISLIAAGLVREQHPHSRFNFRNFIDHQKDTLL